MTKKKDPKDLLKVGRPTKYSLQLAKEISNAIATSELGLLHLVEQNPHWPDRATIFMWRRVHPEFRDLYTQAKEDQTEVCVEYMQELMNEPHKITDPETGITKVDVPMLRLKVDAIKWHTAKLKPKKYGDASAIEVNDPTLINELQTRKQNLDEKNKKEF